MKKRRRKNRQNQPGSSDASSSSSSFIIDKDDAVEVRPLVASSAIEQGLDYWVPEEELQREKDRKQARRRMNTPSVEQMPDEKLWTEILSPYKQNWIGLISVTIIALAFIVKNFPELTETPIIPLPDL